MKIFTASFSNVKWLCGALCTSIILYVSNLMTVEFRLADHVLVGLIYSIILLILLELKDIRREHVVYSWLAGEYERKEIFQVNHAKSTGSKYEKLDYSKVNVGVILKYVENRMYEIELSYENGIVNGYFFIDQVNLNSGSGGYHYIATRNPEIHVDYGSYNLQVDPLDENVLYVYYKNIVPNGNAEGYEVWIKRKIK